jgi:hypothetical protein
MIQYFDTLKELINELRAAYYFHDDFPKDLWQGVDDLALYQTAIIYPFYPTSGCSYFSATYARNNIAIAEQLIKDMAENICKAAQEKGVIVKGKSLSFTHWELEYDGRLPNKVASPNAPGRHP